MFYKQQFPWVNHLKKIANSQESLSSFGEENDTSEQEKENISPTRRKYFRCFVATCVESIKCTPYINELHQTNGSRPREYPWTITTSSADINTTHDATIEEFRYLNVRHFGE